MGPDGRPLVKDVSLPVSSGGVGYRGVGDSSFTRFEYVGGVASSPYWWLAYAADGTVSRFGLKAQHPYGHAPLVSQADGDGHELKYEYTTVGRTVSAPAANDPREFLPSRISYWSPGKSEAAGDKPYAFVSFIHADPVFCGSDTSNMLPLGSRLDYRSGFAKLSGTRKLTAVRSFVYRPGATIPDERSSYSLNYSSSTESCSSGSASPFRQLDSVQRTAYAPKDAGQTGGFTVLPPTSFTYGEAGAYTTADKYHAAVDVPLLQMPASVDTNALEQYGSNSGTYGTAYKECAYIFCPTPGFGRLEPEIYGLAWQLSAAQASGESATTMWLDVNGDGRTDMLQSSELHLAKEQPKQGNSCMVDVYVNKGADGFRKNDGFGPFTLNNRMADIPFGDDPSQHVCSLNRSFSSSFSGFQGDASRPCTDAQNWKAPAAWKSMQQVRHAYIDVDGDLRPDLVAQPIASVHCPYASTHGVPAPRWDNPEVPDSQEPDDAHWVTEAEFNTPSQGGEMIQITARQAFWYVYKNTGSGFAGTPVKVPAGRPLDTQLGERIVKVPEAGFVNAFQAPDASRDGKQNAATLVDMTGDGFLDFVTDSNFLLPGLRGGGFGDPIALPAPVDPQNGDHVPWKDRGCDATEVCQGGAGVALEEYTGFLKGGQGPDFNSDGLPDRISAVNGGTKIFYNTGTGYAGTQGQAMFSQDHTDTRRLESTRFREDQKDWQGYPTKSLRYNRNSTLDVDYDGIPDVLHYRAGSRAKAYLGGGAAWVKAADSDLDVAADLAGSAVNIGTQAENTYVDRGDYEHRYQHKAADINGDGLLDLVRQKADNTGVEVRYARAILNTFEARKAPARLLRTVDNGFGSTTTVSYGRSVTAKKWVATEISVNPGQGEPVVATKYSYAKSTYMPGAYGQSSFRGFREMRAMQVGDTANTSDDITTITQLAYDQDPGGVPVRTATVLGGLDFALTGTDPGGDVEPASAQSGVMSLTDTLYHVRDLGVRIPGSVDDFAHTVVMPKQVTSYTCTGTTGQTAQACEANAPKKTDATTWQRHPLTGPYVMDLPSRHELEFTNADGQTEIRRTTPEHNVASTPTAFVVAPDKTTDTVVVNGTETPMGETRYTYTDSEFRYVKNVTVDDAKTGIADRTTRFQYYGGTGPDRGQVYRTWQPEQVARYGNTNTAAGYTETAYDAHGVTVARTIAPAPFPDTETGPDPLVQETRQHVDLATGAVLETSGPNYACPDADGSGSLEPAESCTYQQAEQANLTSFARNQVDGLGRPVSTRVYAIGDTTRDPVNGGTEVAKATYNDSAA
ncbi:RHS repeat domain-containing protein, partial [Streptomyces cinereoruber]|uniref:hypothetical protein n=1 Tax=Streptomyces cinereoruber TaxID=67260 RepID=UPI00363BEC94